MEPSIIDLSIVPGIPLAYAIGGAAKEAITDALKSRDVKSVERSTRSREALGRVVERGLR